LVIKCISTIAMEFYTLLSPFPGKYNGNDDIADIVKQLGIHADL